MKNKSNGFTLIELMIVVAIIAILASIAIPKFADLLIKAREATTRGNLGAIRSAINSYCASNDGLYPIGQNNYSANSTVLTAALVPAYIKQDIPGANNLLTCFVPTNHAKQYTVDNYSKYDLAAPDDAACDGEWAYVGNRNSADWGYFFVECWDDDSKGKPVTDW